MTKQKTFYAHNRVSVRLSTLCEISEAEKRCMIIAVENHNFRINEAEKGEPQLQNKRGR